MTELVVIRGEDGRLEGFGERGRRAWLKFRKLIAELEIGQTLKFTYKLPRSPRHHRFFFAKLAGLFDRQDQFQEFRPMLEWLKVGAGHVDMLPGRDGIPVAIPQSIAWENLEEQDFIEFHRAMNDFLNEEFAMATLWPNQTDRQRHANLWNWHTEFDNR